MILTRPTFMEIVRCLNTRKLLSASALGLAVLYLGKIWNSYTFFSKRGLKTPPYRFFFGNFLQVRSKKKLSECLENWTKLYGKTYGYYQGHTPIIVTSDLAFISEVFIKQYKNFSAKKRLPLDREDDASKVPIIAATKGRWKRMRNIMNPTFSTSKMKELNPLMHVCVERLLRKIDANVDSEIDIMSLFKRFTMDTIWNVGFGLDRDMQFSSQGDLYIKNSDDSLKTFADFSFLMYLATYFSEIRRFIVYFHLLLNHLAIKLFGEKYVDALFWIREEVIEVVEARRNDLQRGTMTSKKRDYLQILMDAHCDFVGGLEENSKMDFAQLHLSKKLSIDEIKMNLSIFLMAGSESTSIALAVLVYLLACLPDEQEKLYHEIEEHFPRDADFEPTHENINKLEYLDMIIRESLRMYPIAHPACTRRCVKHTNVNGIDIPEDVTVVVDVMSIHYDPELWGPEDPKMFYPLRFADKQRNPLAFMAFGQGPRNCIGMKFAYMELKMSIIEIIRHFEVVRCEKTANELDFIEGVIGILTHDVIVKFKKRY